MASSATPASVFTTPIRDFGSSTPAWAQYATGTGDDALLSAASLVVSGPANTPCFLLGKKKRKKGSRKNTIDEPLLCNATARTPPHPAAARGDVARQHLPLMTSASSLASQYSLARALGPSNSSLKVPTAQDPCKWTPFATHQAQNWFMGPRPTLPSIQPSRGPPKVPLMSMADAQKQAAVVALPSRCNSSTVKSQKALGSGLKALFSKAKGWLGKSKKADKASAATSSTGSAVHCVGSGTSSHSTDKLSSSGAAASTQSSSSNNTMTTPLLPHRPATSTAVQQHSPHHSRHRVPPRAPVRHAPPFRRLPQRSASLSEEEQQVFKPCYWVPTCGSNNSGKGSQGSEGTAPLLRMPAQPTTATAVCVPASSTEQNKLNVGAATGEGGLSSPTVRTPTNSTGVRGPSPSPSSSEITFASRNSFSPISVTAHQGSADERGSSGATSASPQPTQLKLFESDARERPHAELEAPPAPSKAPPRQLAPSSLAPKADLPISSLGNTSASSRGATLSIGDSDCRSSTGLKLSAVRPRRLLHSFSQAEPHPHRDHMLRYATDEHHAYSTGPSSSSSRESPTADQHLLATRHNSASSNHSVGSGSSFGRKRVSFVDEASGQQLPLTSVLGKSNSVGRRTHCSASWSQRSPPSLGIVDNSTMGLQSRGSLPIRGLLKNHRYRTLDGAGVSCDTASSISSDGLLAQAAASLPPVPTTTNDTGMMLDSAARPSPAAPEPSPNASSFTSGRSLSFSDACRPTPMQLPPHVLHCPMQAHVPATASITFATGQAGTLAHETGSPILSATVGSAEALGRSYLPPSAPASAPVVCVPQVCSASDLSTEGLTVWRQMLLQDLADELQVLNHTHSSTTSPMLTATNIAPTPTHMAATTASQTICVSGHCSVFSSAAPGLQSVSAMPSTCTAELMHSTPTEEQQQHLRKQLLQYAIHELQHLETVRGVDDEETQQLQTAYMAQVLASVQAAMEEGCRLAPIPESATSSEGSTTPVASTPASQACEVPRLPDSTGSGDLQVCMPPSQATATATGLGSSGAGGYTPTSASPTAHASAEIRLCMPFKLGVEGTDDRAGNLGSASGIKCQVSSPVNSSLGSAVDTSSAVTSTGYTTSTGAEHFQKTLSPFQALDGQGAHTVYTNQLFTADEDQHHVATQDAPMWLLTGCTSGTIKPQAALGNDVLARAVSSASCSSSGGVAARDDEEYVSCEEDDDVVGWVISESLAQLVPPKRKKSARTPHNDDEGGSVSHNTKGRRSGRRNVQKPRSTIGSKCSGGDAERAVICRSGDDSEESAAVAADSCRLSSGSGGHGVHVEAVPHVALPGQVAPVYEVVASCVDATPVPVAYVSEQAAGLGADHSSMQLPLTDSVNATLTTWLNHMLMAQEPAMTEHVGGAPGGGFVGLESLSDGALEAVLQAVKDSAVFRPVLTSGPSTGVLQAVAGCGSIHGDLTHSASQQVLCPQARMQAMLQEVPSMPGGAETVMVTPTLKDAIKSTTEPNSQMFEHQTNMTHTNLPQSPLPVAPIPTPQISTLAMQPAPASDQQSFGRNSNSNPLATSSPSMTELLVVLAAGPGSPLPAVRTTPPPPPAPPARSSSAVSHRAGHVPPPPPPPPPAPLSIAKVTKSGAKPPPPLPPPTGAAGGIGGVQISRYPSIITLHHELRKALLGKSDLPAARTTVARSAGSAEGGDGLGEVLGEISAKSSYQQQILRDADEHASLLRHWAGHLASVNLSTMSEVIQVVKDLDMAMAVLSDEITVIKTLSQDPDNDFTWPTARCDALRMAAAMHVQLSGLAATQKAWKLDLSKPLPTELSRITKAHEQLVKRVDTLTRDKENLDKRFKESRVPFNWAIMRQLQLSALRPLALYLQAALKRARELKSELRLDEHAERIAAADTARPAGSMRPGGYSVVASNMDTLASLIKVIDGAIAHAFKCHQFVGGFDVTCTAALEQLKPLWRDARQQREELRQ